MDYEGQICRPPMEKSSFMLPVAVGCAYNQCKFCTLFKHLNHRLLPLEQIERELQRVRDVGGTPKQVFLGDGNAFGMDTLRLLSIVEMIRSYFPDCNMVNMDATVTDISRKSDDELRLLAMSGVKKLYLGIECGLGDVLHFMHKEHSIEMAYREIRRIQAAGLSFNAHIMTGIAGADRGLENADSLAEFFNRTRPDRIINFSLLLSKNAPLYQDIWKGRFIPANEVENLMEEQRLLALLNGPLMYDGLHDRLGFRVRGNLPRDRQKMLQKLDGAISLYGRRAQANIAWC